MTPLLTAGLRRLVVTLAAAGALVVAVVWTSAVWTDARLASPTPTAFVLDRNGAFLLKR